MPAIKRLLTAHPVTGEVGIWADSAYGIVGLAKSAFPSQPGGPAGTRQQRWQDAINAALAPVGEVRVPLSTFPPDDPRRTTPEPCCRIDGTDYVYRKFTVTVTITAMSPLAYDFAVESCADAPVRL